MWFARYFPGLGIDEDHLSSMTPEETAAMRRAGDRLLKGEAEERFAHTRIVAAAGGLKLR